MGLDRRFGARVAAAAAVTAVTAFAACGSSTGGQTMPPMTLVDAYPHTIRRSTFPLTEAFSVYDATIAGEMKRVVYARPPSRITWKVTPPPMSTLRGTIGIRSDAWIHPGDGVVFRIGVSDGRVYRELVNRHISPHTNPGDRRWVDVSVDLQPFAGKAVEIIFNTEMSVVGTPADGRGDLALWGEPAIVTPR